MREKWKEEGREVEIEREKEEGGRGRGRKEENSNKSLLLLLLLQRLILLWGHHHSYWKCNVINVESNGFES